MLSRRTQWILSAVGLVGLMAYYGFDSEDQDEEPLASAVQPLQEAPGAQAPPADSPVRAAPAQARAGVLAGSAPLDTRQLTRVPILDEDGSLVHEAAIPVGWQLVGGVRWNDATGCPGLMMQRVWTAIGPDSLTSIAMLPGFSWQHEGTQIPTSACPVAPFRTLRQFLQASVQQLYPQGQELDYRDTSAQYQAQMRAHMQAQGAGQAQTGQAPARLEAGMMLVGYRDAAGVEMRAVLSSTMDTTTVGGNVLSGVSNIAVYSGPAGRHDPTLLERVLAGGGKPDPQWLARYQQRAQRNMQRYFSQQRQQIDQWHARQMALINARGEADRHAIRMRTNQEVAGIYSAIAANSSATSDRMHSRTLEAIGEYNSYAGVGGSTVQSSIHGGSRVFQSQTNPGSAYSTNAPYGAGAPGHVELERR